MVATVKDIVVSLGCMVLGAWAFVTVNEISGPRMEPILAACQNPDIPLSEFAEKTGYHAYDPTFGLGIFNFLCCIITQFLLDLVETYPAGILTWMSIIVVSFPLGVWMTIEAGRKDAKGPIRYPLINGLLFQLFGISIVFPLVWIPAYIFGRGSGGANSKRIYAAIPLGLLGLILSVLVFTLSTQSAAWTSCAGFLGGPGVALLVCLLWPIPHPDPNDDKTRRESKDLSAKAFTVAGILSLVLWVWLVAFVIIPHYGFDVGAIWNDIWAGEDASSFVKFMTIDAGVLWLAGVIVIGYVNAQAGMEALLFSLIIGPGAALAFVLARLQKDADANETSKEKSA